MVTAASHGIPEGGRCTIRNVDGGTYDGATGLRDGGYVAKNVTTNTFELYYVDGVTPVECTVEDTDFTIAAQATAAPRKVMDARRVVVTANNISNFFEVGIGYNGASDALAECVVEGCIR